jgi:hypothetical protein
MVGLLEIDSYDARKYASGSGSDVVEVVVVL